MIGSPILRSRGISYGIGDPTATIFVDRNEAFRASQANANTNTMATISSNNDNNSRTACIVVTSATTTGDDALSHVLAARGWRSIPVDDPVVAMAEAALREREQRVRTEWGLLRNEAVAMVIDTYDCDEVAWDERSKLIRAMRRYLPNVALWSFDGKQLVLMTGEGARSEQSGAMTPDPEHAVQKQTQVREQRGRDDDSTNAATEEADVIITREEVDMLLESMGGGP